MMHTYRVSDDVLVDKTHSSSDLIDSDGFCMTLNTLQKINMPIFVDGDLQRVAFGCIIAGQAGILIPGLATRQIGPLQLLYRYGICVLFDSIGTLI